MTALSRGSAFTRRFYDTVTGGGYTPPEERLPVEIPVYSVDEPGISGATAPLDDRDYATGICLVTPAAREALTDGSNPVTGKQINSYGDVQQYLEEGVPALRQVTDQFGITGASGTVAVVLEDEEWTAKLGDTLASIDGIDPSSGQLYEDVRAAYERAFDAFEAYVNDVLGNDLEVVPVFTTDRTGDIDTLLDDAAQERGREVPAGQRNLQRVNLYFTPDWFRYLEQQLGMEDIVAVEPVRFYDELYNVEGTESNMFRNAQYRYFSDGQAENAIAFVPPTITSDSALGISPAATRSDERYRGRNQTDLARNPVARRLTAFPQRQEEMQRLLGWDALRSEWKEQWSQDATVQGFERRERGAYVDIRRDDMAERLGTGDRTVFDQAFEAVETDIATVMEAAR